MRVLHVAPSFARKDGGPSEVLRGLVPALERRGTDVDVFVSDKGADESDADFSSLSNVFVFRSRRPKGWAFTPGIVKALWRAAPDYDALHIHSVNTFTSTVAMLVARARKVPYLLEPHGAFDRYHMQQGRIKKGAYNRTVDRFGLGGAAVLCSTAYEARQAAEVLPRSTFIAPLGVDPGLFRERDALDDHHFRVLFLGRGTQKKRLDLVLKAVSMPELSSVSIILRIAGPLEPRIAEIIEALAKAVPSNVQVEFLGKVDRARRAELLASSDVFVLPSEDESFGVAVAEALAAGCPVIASRHVGVALEPYLSDAMLLSALDASALASYLLNIASDPALRARLSTLGRERARAHLTWDESARQTMAAYLAITGSGTGA